MGLKTQGEGLSPTPLGPECRLCAEPQARSRPDTRAECSLAAGFLLPGARFIAAPTLSLMKAVEGQLVC